MSRRCTSPPRHSATDDRSDTITIATDRPDSEPDEPFRLQVADKESVKLDSDMSDSDKTLGDEFRTVRT